MTDRYRTVESLDLPQTVRADLEELIEQFEAAADEPSELTALSRRAGACRAAARLLSDHPEAVQVLGPSLVGVLAGSLDREHDAAADMMFKTGREGSIQRYAALGLSAATGVRMGERYRAAGGDTTRLVAVLRRTITDSRSDDARRVAVRTLASLIPVVDHLATDDPPSRRLSNSLCQLLHEDLSNTEARSAVEVLAYLSERTPESVPAESVSEAVEAAVYSLTVETKINAFDSDGNRVELDGQTESTLASWGAGGEDSSFGHTTTDDYDRARFEGLVPILFWNLGFDVDTIPIELPWLPSGTEPRDALAEFVRTASPPDRRKAAVVLGEIVALVPGELRVLDSLVGRVQGWRGTDRTRPARALGEVVATPETEPGASVSSLAARLRADRDAIGPGGEEVLGEVAAAAPELFDYVPSALIKRADRAGETGGAIQALGIVVMTGADTLDAAVERLAEQTRTYGILHRRGMIRTLAEIGLAEPGCAPEVPSTLRKRVREVEESEYPSNLHALGEVVAAVNLDDEAPVESLTTLVRGTEDVSGLLNETTCALGEIVAADPLRLADAPTPLVARVRDSEGYAHTRAARALGELVATNPNNADAAVTALIGRVSRGEQSTGRSDHWRTALMLGEVVLADPDRFDAVPDVLVERVAATDGLEQRRAVGTLGEVVAAAEGTDTAVIDCFVERARMPSSESRRHVVHVLGVAVAAMSIQFETVPEPLDARVRQIPGDRWWWSAGVLGEIVAANRYDTDRALDALADRLRTRRGSTRRRCAQAIGELVATSPSRLDARTAQFAREAQASTGQQRCRWLWLTGRIHVRGYPGVVRQLCRTVFSVDETRQEESLKELLALAHTEEVTLTCFLENATVAASDDLPESVDLAPYLSLEQKPRHQFFSVLREFISEASDASQVPDLRTQLRGLLTGDSKVPTATRLLLVDILTTVDGNQPQRS